MQGVIEMEGMGYVFPRDRLALQRVEKGIRNVVVVACGSFNPPTLAHLEMFRAAQTHAQHVGQDPFRISVDCTTW